MISLGYLAGNLYWPLRRDDGRQHDDVIGCSTAAAGMTVGVIVSLMGVDHPLAVFGFGVFVGFGNGLTLPSATTGLLSVRPNLAGSASGLGAAMMIGGGAALSAITGALLTPESGAMPLVAMMAGSAICSVLAALYVIRRAAKVKAMEAEG